MVRKISQRKKKVLRKKRSSKRKSSRRKNSKRKSSRRKSSRRKSSRRKSSRKQRGGGDPEVLKQRISDINHELDQYAICKARNEGQSSANITALCKKHRVWREKSPLNPFGIPRTEMALKLWRDAEQNRVRAGAVAHKIVDSVEGAGLGIPWAPLG